MDDQRQGTAIMSVTARSTGSETCLNELVSRGDGITQSFVERMRKLRPRGCWRSECGSGCRGQRPVLVTPPMRVASVLSSSGFALWAGPTFAPRTTMLALRRNGAIPPELIARCAPTRTEGLNMRGVFRFPIEQYADQLLPSQLP